MFSVTVKWLCDCAKGLYAVELQWQKPRVRYVLLLVSSAAPLTHQNAT